MGKSSDRVLERENEKETIVRFLTKNCTKPVITIWGIGGIGKTTLTRIVCEDEKVQSHFNPTLRANARGAFDLKTIIEDLLELEHDSRGELQKRLKRRIEGKNCLVVLDDVGKLSQEHRQELKDLLQVGIAGLLIATVEDQALDLENSDEGEVSSEPTQAHITIKKRTQSCSEKLGEELGIEELGTKIKDFVLEESEDKLSTLFIEGIMDAESNPVKSICEMGESKFELSKWVSISGEEFNLKRIVRGILDEEEQDKTLERLRIELQGKLQKKRFLIGLDVCGMNAYQCDQLEVLLKNGEVRNKLLIVTRDKQVPPKLEHRKMHLDFLSVDDSLNLIAEFYGDLLERDPKLAKIRREIIDGCPRAPLLLRMFGGILLHETDENKLKDIQEKMKNSSDVTEILKFCFDALPPHVKKCFLYSTCFTNHPPERGRLTQQWIAHDLIKGSENNDRKVEELANEYFDELLSRSFFYNPVPDDLKVETRFEVHDLVYKLAHSEPGGECRTTSSDQLEEIPSSVLHLVLPDKSERFPSLEKFKNLRTLKWENFMLSSATSDTKLDKDSLPRSLRVLDLSGSKFDELPSSIGELRDLRYLDVSYNIYLDELPNSLFNLSNLETLRFEECGIEELPKDLSKLQNLRNLYACTEQVSIPEEEGICVLSSLRILHLNPVRNLETLPTKLENLTALETLVLRCCSKLTLIATNFKGLRSLRNLTITHIEEQKLIPPGLHQDAAASLSSLCLSFCMGMTNLPEWLGKLQCLRRLRIEYCPNLTATLNEISLPKGLQYLSIRGCPELTKICKSEVWQKNAKIQAIHLDGRIIQSISETRSSESPSSSSGPDEEMHEGEAMTPFSPPYSESRKDDEIMFDAEVQAPGTVVKHNPGLWTLQNEDFEEDFESNNSTQTRREDEEGFGTVRAYFDRCGHFKKKDDVLTLVIGKLYDHMVELYGDGERQRQYEKLLRKIKAFLLSPEPDPDADDEDDEKVYSDSDPDSDDEDDDKVYSDFCRESLEGAETTLMSIANAKTNTTETEGGHRHQNSNNDEDHIAGMAEKFPDYDLFLFSHFCDSLSIGRRARALWVVFQHLVKMDDGNCTSLYTSVLSLVCNVIYFEEENATTVDKLVRKLDEIVDVKRGRLTEKELMMGDNASAVTDDDVHLSLKDRVTRAMRWAMSNRRIFQEENFWHEIREIKLCLSSEACDEDERLEFEVVGTLYDHIEELDGGRFRYEYIKAFRKLFKQVIKGRYWYGIIGGDRIDKVEVMFKQIAINKMDITEMEYQEAFKKSAEMCYNDFVIFRSNEDEDDALIIKLKLLVKHICTICRHLLILDEGGDCFGKYWKVFTIIKDACLLTSLEISASQLPSEMSEEVAELLYFNKYHSLRKTLSEIAQKKMNKSNTISNQNENTLAEAAAPVTKEASSAYTVLNDGDPDVRPVLQPRHKWLDTSEILQILQNFETYRMSKEIQQKPPSGSVILYDTKALRFYKKDGYNWKKQSNGRTVTEGHMRLKVGGHDKLHCYYAQSIDDDKFQRRTYSLLNKTSSIRLVHYLDSKVEYSKESENVGREAEDTALDVTRGWYNSRIIKRPRGDPDGDDMNKEIDNQAYFPRNANRTISANTSPLDDEMALLAKEVGSLPEFEKGSDWFFLAMLSFKDKDNKALFKSMEDPNSKVRMLKMILNL